VGDGSEGGGDFVGAAPGSLPPLSSSGRGSVSASEIPPSSVPNGDGWRRPWPRRCVNVTFRMVAVTRKREGRRERREQGGEKQEARAEEWRRSDSRPFPPEAAVVMHAARASSRFQLTRITHR